MKTSIRIVLAAVLLAGGSAIARASDETYLSPKDATLIIDTVNAYIRSSPPSEHAMRLFDPVAGRELLLGYKAIHADDLRVLSTNRFAVCVEFVSQENVDYMLWFVTQKGVIQRTMSGGTARETFYPHEASVQDIIIHRVGGKDRVEWIDGGDGTWKIHALASTSSDTASSAPVASAVCPSCAQGKHDCSKCASHLKYVSQWYLKSSWPFESVHVCSTCGTLAEICSVCMKKS